MRRMPRTTSSDGALFGGRRAPRALSWGAVLVVAGALTSAAAAPFPISTAAPPDEDGSVTRLGAQQAGPKVITGLLGPESVRFDPDQKVWFIGNWNGAASATDNNGMISRVLEDGTVDALDFIQGGRNGTTLHAPRGMTIVGDTLWAADVDAIRGFHVRSGELLAAVDMTRWEPGFLNDIAADDSGTLYITDTGRNRIYRVRGANSSIALEDSMLNRPNGITWNEREGDFVVLPFGGSQTLMSWRAGGELRPWRTLPSGGRYDGIEILHDGRVVVSSQTDSSIYVLPAESSGRVETVLQRIRLEGAPADIAVDAAGTTVAVPYVARNLVELWPIGTP